MKKDRYEVHIDGHNGVTIHFISEPEELSKMVQDTSGINRIRIYDGVSKTEGGFPFSNN